MTNPTHPYLLFHPRFICKFGNPRSEHGRWDFREARNVYEKRWWRAGCFAIDAEMRRLVLLDVLNKGPAWIWENLLQPRTRTFLIVEHVFADTEEQLSFDQARAIFVDEVCDNGWWTATGETEQQFRARNAAYTSWRELIEKVSLAGRYP